MKGFKTVFGFELANYFKTKSFIVSTIVLAIVSAGLMFIPRVKDAFTDDDKDKNTKVEESVSDENDKDIIALYDKTGTIDLEILETYFPKNNYTIVECTDEKTVSDMVENEEAKEGYVVNSDKQFDMFIFNKGLFADPATNFEEFMKEMLKINYCRANNINAEEFMAVESAEIENTEKVFGKDETAGYGYSYALVIIIFILVIAYGMQIASGVTNEKSNRSIEILVTSVSTNAILFGKVVAGVVAVFFQVGIIGGSAIASYQYNKEYLGDIMAMFFDIPSEVLIVYLIFGIGGYLFYAFAYGALGALVSKIEDLNKSAGTAQMVITLVYMASLFSLADINGIVMKILSFLPVSSYSAMFTRVGMGEVATWEIVVSAIILYASVIGMGIIGGKIFRNSTLRYGNPIKLSSAIKGLKKNN